MYNLEGLHRGRVCDGGDIAELMKQHDFVGLCETWVGSRSDVQKLRVDGYSLILSRTRKKKTRLGRMSGGVAVYVKTRIFRKLQALIFDSSLPDVSWVVINRTEDEKLAIGFVYNPDQSSVYADPEFFVSLEEEMCKLEEEHPGVRFLLLGDFNARTGNEREFVIGDEEDVSTNGPIQLPDWYPFTGRPKQRNSKDELVNAWGRKLLEWSRLNSLLILNGRVPPDESGEITCAPRTGGSSVVDYGLASASVVDGITRFEVLNDFIESSHFPISLDLEIGLPEDVEQEDQDHPTQQNGPTLIPKYTLASAEVSSYQGWIAGMLGVLSILCVFLTRTKSVEEAIDAFQQFVRQAARACKVMTRPFVNRGKPWFDATCEALRQACRQAVRTLRRCGGDQALNQFIMAKRKYKKRCRERRRDHERRLQEEVKRVADKGDAAGFWRIIKRFRRRAAGNENGTAGIKASKWKEHFDRIFNAGKDLNTNWAQVAPEEEVVVESLDKDVSVSEVIRSIRDLKNGKAPGLDGIGGEFYKAIGGLICGLLSFLFSSILRVGLFPRAWVRGLVCPIFKGKGSPKRTDSYRGIMLLPSIAKILTMILARRLRDWVEENNIISEAQTGFRRGYSTVDNCFVLDTLRAKALSRRGRKLYVCFVDMKRAFDSVLRPLLFYKLYQLGVRGPFLRLLKDMYSKCEFCIRIDSSSASDCVKSTTGVMQGCTLSPTLFSIFINDVVEYLSSDTRGHHCPLLLDTPVECLLYADDLALISESSVGLQRQLDRLHTYCERWGLEVNRSKTEVMVFRRGGKLANHERWYYAGERLSVSSEFRYLGVVYSTKGGWSKHVGSAVDRANKVIHLLRAFVFRMTDLRVEILLRIFNVMVRPVVTYGAEVWGHSPSALLNKPLAKFCRLVLGLPNGAPTAGVLLELGVVPTGVDCQMQVLRYWVRLMHMPPHRWARKAYEVQRRLANAGVTSWGLGLARMMREIDKEAIWHAGRVGNTKQFLEEARVRLIAISNEELNREIQLLDSLGLYRTHTVEPRSRIYFLIHERSVRRSIAAIRLNLSHIFPSDVYQHFPEFDTYICNWCNADYAQGIWHHLVTECQGLEQVQNETLGPVECFARLVFSGDVMSSRRLHAFFISVMRLARESTTN